jgi:hypothetical protein
MSYIKSEPRGRFLVWPEHVSGSEHDSIFCCEACNFSRVILVIQFCPNEHPTFRLTIKRKSKIFEFCNRVLSRQLQFCSKLIQMFSIMAVSQELIYQSLAHFRSGETCQKLNITETLCDFSVTCKISNTADLLRPISRSCLHKSPD